MGHFMPQALPPAKSDKTRLDIRLVELGLAPSRNKAQALIVAGDVCVDGAVCSKPSVLTGPDQKIELKQKEKFVSRGGLKLEGALADLSVDPSGKCVIDVGASTGGFTDCLLQKGAVHVTAVDVGYGQIAVSLRSDPRVTLKERTNARYLKPGDFDAPFDLALIDVSFISLDKILPVVMTLLRPGGEILALIKPQFEAGRAKVKKGVVKDATVHETVIQRIRSILENLGCEVLGVKPSRLQGPKGNVEFFVYAIVL